MNVRFRYIERTCLNERAYERLIKKYGLALQYDVLIIFDLRIKNWGSYNFDKKKNMHIIQISPRECAFSDEGVKFDEGAEKYHLISTTIHELYHAKQYENMGEKFWNYEYTRNGDICNDYYSDHFSEREIETRIYENRNLLGAIEFYDCYCAEDVVE